VRADVSRPSWGTDLPFGEGSTAEGAILIKIGRSQGDSIFDCAQTKIPTVWWGETDRTGVRDLLQNCKAINGL